jgi:hypothetical protein
MPRSVGTKFDTKDQTWEAFEKDSKHKPRNHLAKNPPQMIPINGKMSQNQQRRANRENRRRDHVNRILDEADKPQAVPENENERLKGIAKYKYTTEFVDNIATNNVPFYRPYISNRRYKEISRYLTDSYLDLALDTLFLYLKVQCI